MEFTLTAKGITINEREIKRNGVIKDKSGVWRKMWITLITSSISILLGIAYSPLKNLMSPPTQECADTITVNIIPIDSVK